MAGAMEIWRMIVDALGGMVGIGVGAAVAVTGMAVISVETGGGATSGESGETGVAV